MKERGIQKQNTIQKVDCGEGLVEFKTKLKVESPQYVHQNGLLGLLRRSQRS